jgi:SAM-dependent methyltransferase
MIRSMKRSKRRYAGVSSIDRAFNELVPPELRHLSLVHWTPVDIAARAVTLLCPWRNTRVLDVGAGVGKLCTIGALSEIGTWCGVEHHESLVEVAGRIARKLGVAGRTSFVHSDAFAIDWCEFDAIYLYNPFEHSLAVPGSGGDCVDGRIQAARVRERLMTLRSGTRVVTLHGFGAAMPPGFDLLYHERVPVYGLDLVLWIQGAASRRTRGVS